jgi:hypothetical protein
MLPMSPILGRFYPALEAPMSNLTTVTAAADRLKATLTGEDREALETILQYARDLRTALGDNAAFVQLQTCHCSAVRGYKCDRCRLIASNAKALGLNAPTKK